MIVLHVHQLSFENVVYTNYPHYATNGQIAYYLRFDIPYIFRAPHVQSFHSQLLELASSSARPQQRGNNNSHQHGEKSQGTDGEDDCGGGDGGGCGDGRCGCGCGATNDDGSDNELRRW